MNKIVVAVNILLALAPSLLRAQAFQQKPIKVVEIRVTVYQAPIRSKAGSVTEKMFIPEEKSKRSYQLNGTLETFDRDAIVLSQDEKKERYVIPWPVIRKLEIKHEKKSKAGTGALVGLLAGGTAGAIIGSQVEFCIFDCSPATGFGLIIGSAGGLIVGTMVGAALGTDGWEKLPLDQQALELKLLEKR
ncbi:MAG: hypothetical protein ACRENG_13920 [bacterium]